MILKTTKKGIQACYTECVKSVGEKRTIEQDQ